MSIAVCSAVSGASGRRTVWSDSFTSSLTVKKRSSVLSGVEDANDARMRQRRGDAGALHDRLPVEAGIEDPQRHVTIEPFVDGLPRDPVVGSSELTFEPVSVPDPHTSGQARWGHAEADPPLLAFVRNASPMSPGPPCVPTIGPNSHTSPGATLIVGSSSERN